MSIRFLTPVEGECLCNRAGIITTEGITVKVTLQASADHVTVNGITAAKAGNTFTASVLLVKGENTLTATADSGERAAVSVWYLPNATGRFRISLDDNIRFLADIAAHKDTYQSVFEAPYLALLRRLHEEYGAKFHANLFYATDDGSFTLADMPDTFREEWRANADWLRFSFHARTEHPDRPYLTDDGTRLARDLAEVKREILRFAGEECYAKCDTTLHFGACTRDGAIALHRAGVRHVAGFFNPDANGNAGSVSYHLTGEKLPAIAKNGIWYDTDSALFCAKIDVVLNTGPIHDLRGKLDAAWEKSPVRGCFEALMHEQYFYEDYYHYLPDFEARLRVALDFAREHALKPAFLSELTE